MDYKTYPQNIDNGRTETCPRCELENIDSDWNYCPICSLPTQNVCEDCGEKLEPHFRYCPKCGTESLYFKEKALTHGKMNATHKTVPLQQREPLGMRIISLSNQLKQKKSPTRGNG